MKFSSIILIVLSIFSCFFANPLLAQPPQLIPYQAIARDNVGNPVLNQNIGLKFSIHDQTISGAVVWQESQTVVSNNLGIIVTALGGTTQLTSVDWGSGAKFLQVEMDIAGGTNYLDMGAQQMMSVPYALYAETSGSVINNGGGNGSFTHWIGEYYQGGVICHLWKDAQGVEHGLIVSIENLGIVDQFSMGSLNSEASALGLKTNTHDGIYNSGICNGGAFDLCANYSHDGYSDWYFPSYMEMEGMLQNRLSIDLTLLNIPGADTFTAGYWADFSNTPQSYGNTYFVYCNSTISTASMYSACFITMFGGLMTTFTSPSQAFVRAFRKF